MDCDSMGSSSTAALSAGKRKAAGGLAERREPRRGLGVAALESIRAARMAAAKGFYMFPPPPPPIGYFPGARLNPYVGNEGLQRDYYYQQQYYTSDVSARILQASSGHVMPRQTQTHQQVDRSAGAVTAAAPPPLLPEHEHHRQLLHQHCLQEHEHHRQMQVQPHHSQTRRPTVDGAGAGEELDLELRL